VIRGWWDRLSPRDRRVLVVGGVLAAALLGWALLWQPLRQARAELAAQVVQQRADLESMRRAAAELRALRGQGGFGHADRQGKSLLALADATARAAGLTGALKRVEPVGPTSVRVSFETASFDVLIDWLERLSRDYGVTVSDFSADRVEGLGLVDARVTLQDHP
jgi:general secretion pathway protein M